MQEVVDTKEEIVVAEAVAEEEVGVVGVVGAAETAIGFAPIQGDFFILFYLSDLRFLSLFCPYLLVALSFYSFGV